MRHSSKALFIRALMGATALTIAGTGVGFAQEIEEVVVTARKKEESLQTVPLAVTVQSAETLARQHITQPTDLGRTVPSLRIVNGSSSANSAVIILRGQAASDTQIGISQPIGLYQDYVNIPHPFGSNGAFFDLERVEVLKGPQGTLYGRNTTGGAVNIITKSADFKGVHGFAEGEVGNFKNWRVAGAVNIPVIEDKLAVRLGFQHWNRDGYGKSKITGQRLGDDKDDTLFRAGLKFEPTSTFSANLKYEYGKANHTGPLLANISLSPVAALTNNGYMATALFINPTLYRPIVRDAFTAGSPTQAASLATAVAAGKPLLDSCITPVKGNIYTTCNGTTVFDNLKTWHFSLDMNWDITDDVRLRSITGGRHYSNFKNGDLDATPAELLEIGYGIGGTHPPGASGGTLVYPTGRGLELKADQATTQWTQEFNLSGEMFDKRLSWLVGAFAAEDKGHGAQNNAFQPDIALARGLDPGLGSNDAVGGENRSWAVFTQNDFHITDQLSVTLGARHTQERLDSDFAGWTYNFTTGRFTCRGAVATPVGSFLATTFPAPNQNDPESCLVGGVLTEGPGRIFQRKKFKGTTYLASANYQITPDKLVYAKIAKGFRGGAYSRTHDLMAEPEIAKDIEVGFKGDWFNHRLRTNFAAFRTNYTNKQVSIQTCAATGLPPVGGTCPIGTAFSTIIRNAASARLKGLEGEITFKPVEGLTINASASKVKAVYTDWPGAVSAEGAPINAVGEPITVGAYGTPDWQGDINARYEFDVGPGRLGILADYAIRGRIPVSKITNYAAVPDAVEREINRKVGLLNGRIDYTLPDMGLELGLFVTNLTKVKHGGNGISANFTAGVGHMVVYAPRMYGLTIKKTFGE